MFLINLNAEIVACILSPRKSRHKPNLESTSKYGFSPDLGGKNGGVLSMRMQVLLDSSFVRSGSAPIWGGKRGEFRDWTSFRNGLCHRTVKFTSPSHHRFSLAGQRLSGIYIHTINETCPSDAFRKWPWNVELRKAKIPQLQYEHVRWEIPLVWGIPLNT